MISAKEAKILYEKSGQLVEDYLKHNVEQEIIKASNNGERTVTILLDSIENSKTLSQAITPLHNSICERLKELGYNVNVTKYGNSYVPKGLANDLGYGPLYTNYGIIITW